MFGPRTRTALLAACVAAALDPPASFAARPTPGALAPDRLKLPAGPSSVRGLAEEPEVDPFYARIGASVPIEAPAGYGKLAPALALTYSGALGNGPLGIGWTMPGARIERSQRLGVPRFDASDELELTGPVSGRLIAIAPDEYRVEGLGQTVRARKVGDGFEVDLGDGTHLRLGATAAARQGDGGARTLAWLVEEQTNLAGERIAYTYERDQGQVYLARVAWGPAQRYAVELAYVARPDATVSYREGFRVVTARRLDRIRVVAVGVERRAYQMHYDDQFSVSRLARVSSTGRAGAGAWPELVLDYASPGSPAVAAMPGVGTWRLNANGVVLVDLDGDGASDLLQLADGGHSYRLNQNGSFGPAQPLTGNTQSITSLQLQDVDGDARAELLQDTGAGWSVWKWSKTKWLLQALPGGVWPGSVGLALKNPASTRFADLNGDGLIDAIKWDNDNLKIYQATRTGMAAPREVPRIGGTQLPSAAGRFQDANGDGLDDYLVVAPDRLDVYTGRGDGTFEPVVSRPYPFAEPVISADDIHLVDLDRDELLDLVRVDLGTVRWYRGTAAGGFSATPTTVGNPEPLTQSVVVTLGDLNGNGSQDLVWSSASNMWSLDVAGPTTAGMLVRTRNGLGLDVSFAYRSAHALSVDARLANDPWQVELPIAMPVPVRKTTALGPGETTRQIDYLVRDGFWDAAERRFGGFLGTIETTWGATPAQTSSVQRRYHSGTGASRALRGKVLVEQVRDGSGRRLAATTHTWEAMLVAGLPDVPTLRKAVLREVRTRYEDLPPGTPVRETSVTHAYDALGRAIRTVDAGRLDLAFDDTVHERRYADDAATWVRDQLCEDKVLSTSGELVRHTEHLFGDHLVVEPLCVVGRGWPRETRGWLASEARMVTRQAASYDGHGNVIATVDAGVARAITYDADGVFPIEERLVPGPGNVQRFAMTWDPVLGVPVTFTDVGGHVTHASYDALGRIAALSLDGQPAHLRVDYDFSAPFPKTTTWEFDAAASALTGDAPAWTTGGSWRQTVEVSNGKGELRYRAVRRAANEWIIGDYTERDPASRVVFRGRPVYASQLELAARPPGISGDLLGYDPLGRLIEQRLPTGARRSYSYAAFERTVQEDTLAPVHSVFDGQGRVILTERTAADGAREVVEARHDAEGRIVEMWLSGGAVKRAFRYDTLGRLVSTSDPDLGTRDLAWDDGGRLVQETNAVGQVASYRYDAAGRVVERDDGGLYRFHYDAARPGAGAGPAELAGRLAWVEEPTGTVDLGYDALGRVIYQRRAIDDRAATETSAYTASGLLAQRSFDDGLSLLYRYDPAGRLIGVGDVWSLAELDAAGNPLREGFGNGAQASYRRDVLGLVSGVTVRDLAARPIYDVEIARNAWSGIDAVRDLDGAGLDHSAQFTYDSFSRLTAAQLAGHTFQYGYDVLHNMTSRVASGPTAVGVFTGDYRYEGSGPRQLTSISDASGTHALTYDGAGRQISRDDLSMSFDAIDRLVRVTSPAGVTAHAYGYDGARVRTIGDDKRAAYWFLPGYAERRGVREHDLSIGDRVIARATVTEDSAVASPAFGGVAAGYALWGLAGVAAAVALAAGGRRRWRRAGAAGLAGLALATACTSGVPLATHRAAVWSAPTWIYQHAGVAAGPVVFTGSDGLLLEERRYEPFGAPIDANQRDGAAYVVGAPDLVARDRNVLNKRVDAATGWSDHGARWMAPETGRWLSPDPPVRAPDEKFMLTPWDLHPYQYVAQNPIAYWDPDGRQPRPADDGKHAALIALPEHNQLEGKMHAAEIVIHVIHMIYESAVEHHDAQQRSFAALEVRANERFLQPVIQAELAAARARGSVPVGDDVRMRYVTGGSLSGDLLRPQVGGTLINDTRRSIAEALRTGNTEVIEMNVRMLQGKLRQYYNDETAYYRVGPDGVAQTIPYADFPKPGDFAQRRAPDGRLEGYGPQAMCTSSLEGVSCAVK